MPHLHTLGITFGRDWSGLVHGSASRYSSTPPHQKPYPHETCSRHKDDHAPFRSWWVRWVPPAGAGGRSMAKLAHVAIPADRRAIRVKDTQLFTTVSRALQTSAHNGTIRGKLGGPAIAFGRVVTRLQQTRGGHSKLYHDYKYSRDHCWPIPCYPTHPPSEMMHITRRSSSLNPSWGFKRFLRTWVFQPDSIHIVPHKMPSI